MSPEVLAGIKVFVGWWAVWLIAFTFTSVHEKKGGGDGLSRREVWLGAPITAGLCWAIWWGFW